jgi:isopentenyldiphosphate isomerase
MPDELLDVVDDDDIVIGREMRSVVHQRGLQHRGVHLFLFTQDGRLLVQRRSKDRAASPLLLDCSVSEHVRAGEDYRTAAIRGLQEELGLKELELREIVTFKMNYGPNDNEISRIYQGPVDPTLVRFDPVELDQIAYYDLAELLNRMKSGEEAFCRWFVQIIHWAVGNPSELRILQVHTGVHLPWFSIK